MLLADPDESTFEFASKILINIYGFLVGSGVVWVAFLIFTLLLKKCHYGKSKILNYTRTKY